MPSFSLDFPDNEILEVLGDDIEVIDDVGTSTMIKGVFEHKYMENELGDEVGIHYPTVEVDNDKASLFQKKYRVIFETVEYSVLNVIPSDVEKTLVILRSRIK